jgi:hypothetical protein
MKKDENKNKNKDNNSDYKKHTKIIKINSDFRERNQFNIKEAIREIQFNR